MNEKGLPNVDEILGVAPDWCGGLTVDEYIDQQRSDGGVT